MAGAQPQSTKPHLHFADEEPSPRGSDVVQERGPNRIWIMAALVAALIALWQYNAADGLERKLSAANAELARSQAELAASQRDLATFSERMDVVRDHLGALSTQVQALEALVAEDALPAQGVAPIEIP
jgi:septal ring factor EnvC (AmiA/AmiB activator)